MSISIGDIVEFSSDFEDMRLAKVIEIKKHKVEAIDLSNGAVVIMSLDSLFDKQEVTGTMLTPREERDLFSLGAKNLWIRLNPIQLNKYLANKSNCEESIEKEKKLEENQIKFLMNLFKKEENSKHEQVNIFDEEKKLPNSPLLKFMKKGQEIQ
jgi:hypothetical protein